MSVCDHGKKPSEPCLECDARIAGQFSALLMRTQKKTAPQLDRGMVEEVLEALRATSPNVEIISGLIEIIDSQWIKGCESIAIQHGCKLDPATAARYGRIVARAKEAIRAPVIKGTVPPDNSASET